MSAFTSLAQIAHSYFEHMLRYCKFFEHHPQFLGPTLAVFVDARGLQNPSGLVRARACYLLQQLMKRCVSSSFSFFCLFFSLSLFCVCVSFIFKLRVQIDRLEGEEHILLIRYEVQMGWLHPLP